MMHKELNLAKQKIHKIFFLHVVGPCFYCDDSQVSIPPHLNVFSTGLNKHCCVKNVRILFKFYLIKNDRTVKLFDFISTINTFPAISETSDWNLCEGNSTFRFIGVLCSPYMLIINSALNFALNYM